MRTGHKRQMAAGVLALVLGISLILYVCLADRQWVSLAAVAAVLVTAGLVTFCAGVTAVPVKRKEENAR